MKVKLKCFAKLSEGDVCDYTASNEKEISEGETVGSLISPSEISFSLLAV